MIRYVCRCGAISDERRCPECQRKPWANAKARTSLSGSAQQARARQVISRDLGYCHICGLLGADEADHVIPVAEGGADDASNMKAAHAECHREKTAAEAVRGRQRASAGDYDREQTSTAKASGIETLSIERSGQ